LSLAGAVAHISFWRIGTGISTLAATERGRYGSLLRSTSVF
jgi:hypothetical protein